MVEFLENIKEKVRDLWRPRTEMMRQIKHRLLFGEKAPKERKGRRFLSS